MSQKDKTIILFAGIIFFIFGILDGVFERAKEKKETTLVTTITATEKPVQKPVVQKPVQTLRVVADSTMQLRKLLWRLADECDWRAYHFVNDPLNMSFEIDKKKVVKGSIKIIVPYSGYTEYMCQELDSLMTQWKYEGDYSGHIFVNIVICDDEYKCLSVEPKGFKKLINW
jgi:hypothetical protein